MQQFWAELRFLRVLIGLSLASVMEYRASFLSQIVFMFLNNGIYFLFWLILFGQFGSLQGYELADMYLLFALVALGFGLGNLFVGNTGVRLATMIAQGQLDYYLVLPRRLLPHLIFSRMEVSAMGDIAFGLTAVWLTDLATVEQYLLFLLAAILAGIICIGFTVLSGSLAFFIGNAQYISQQLNNGLITFAMYPDVLFSGGVRLLLYSLLPAFFIGAVPVQIVRQANWGLLAGLAVVAVIICGLATAVFATGLRRYESGNGINING